ncbi:MAG: DUF3575 domain-containing protein [Bacteroidia bacterium]|jgi:hypothetical protein|nr:DUF3575 domain-containing protein [Bacteroidia bacterium]
MRYFIIIPLCFFFVSNVCGQIRKENKKKEFNHYIKINPFSPAVDALTLQYEKRLSKDASFISTVNYVSYLNSFAVNEGRTFGLSAEYRFYLESNEMVGWYIQPFIRYHYIKLFKVPGNFNTYSGGLLIGYQKKISERFCVDIFGGPYYARTSIVDNNNLQTFIDTNLPIVNAYWLRAGMHIGYSF